MTKYVHVAVMALASISLAGLSGCSSENEPGGSGAGAPGVGGAPASTGGAPASTGGAFSTGGTFSTGGGVSTGGALTGTGGAPAAGGTPGATGGAPASAGAPAAGAPSNPPAGDLVQGKAAYDSICMVCHGETAGGGIGPNISGSVSAGIGSWTEAEFNRAVREAIGRNGEKYCALMVAYPASAIPDTDLRNIYAYLLSLKNDTPNKGNGCP